MAKQVSTSISVGPAPLNPQTGDLWTDSWGMVWIYDTKGWNKLKIESKLSYKVKLVSLIKPPLLIERPTEWWFDDAQPYAGPYTNYVMLRSKPQINSSRSVAYYTPMPREIPEETINVEWKEEDEIWEGRIKKLHTNKYQHMGLGLPEIEITDIRQSAE